VGLAGLSTAEAMFHRKKLQKRALNLLKSVQEKGKKKQTKDALWHSEKRGKGLGKEKEEGKGGSLIFSGLDLATRWTSNETDCKKKLQGKIGQERRRGGNHG